MDPGGQIFRFLEDPISITLDNASVSLFDNPVWQSDQSLTLEATDGNSVVSQFAGNQGPTTTIRVASGANLQLADSGVLGSNLPDSARLNFFATDNSADIEGVFDIFRSHVIFPTGGGEVLVHNGGELSVSGSNETVLETGTLRVDGGSIVMGAGSNTIQAQDLILNNASVILDDNAQIYSSLTRVSGDNTISIGSNPGGFDSQLSTSSLFVRESGSDPNLTIAGHGKVITPLVILDSFSGNALVRITESATLEIIAGADNAWDQGSMEIEPDAGFLIESGGVVAKRIPIRNNGFVRVTGTLLPEGTMTGTGHMRITGNGKLGPLGNDTADTFTSSADIFMDDLSRLEVAIDPTAGTAQQLVAESLFTLGGLVGVFLTLDIFNDTVLLIGTKFTIVDYPDGNDVVGRFIKQDFSPVNEGDLISLGLNTYRISYADPDYDPDNSSVITLTVAEPETTDARFHVPKLYSDGNTASVNATLTCDGGDPQQQTLSVSPGNPVNFTLTNFISDSVQCEVTESDGPDGYVPSFDNGSTVSDISCVFDPVHSGNVYSCTITNDDDAVTQAPNALPVPVNNPWALALLLLSVLGLGWYFRSISE